MTIRLGLLYGVTKTLHRGHRWLIPGIATTYCGNHQILRVSLIKQGVYPNTHRCPAVKEFSYGNCHGRRYNNVPPQYFLFIDDVARGIENPLGGLSANTMRAPANVTVARTSMDAQ